jgi:ADP-Ribosyltransferase in polyvalent proteins
MKLVITEEQFNKLININESKFNGVVLYHGSNHEISRFSDDFIGAEQAVDANGPGIYFSDNKEDSEHYGKILYTVRLKPCNIITDKSKKELTPAKLVQLIKLNPDWQIYAQDWDENPNKGLSIFISDTFSDEDNSKDMLLNVWSIFYRHQSVTFARNCTKLGIDGVNVTNNWGGGGSSEHYVIYNPNIIEVLDINKTNGD